MSRKVGYEFCPLPRKLHPVWAGATLYMRGLIWALFELNDGGPITVTGDDWLESICKQLIINGRDRPNVRKELLKLQAQGALKVSQDRVSVAFFPHDQVTPIERHNDAVPTPVVCTTTVPTTPVVHQSHIPLESNPQNDSDHVLQTERREEKEREIARARDRSARFERPPIPEAPPNTPPSEPAPIRPEARCWQLYQRALGTEHLMLPPNHHDALQALASAAKAEADGATHGDAFDRAAERILGVWMAEKYWQEKRPGLRNLKERLEEGKYARPKCKPIVKLAPPPKPADSLMDHWQRLDAAKREEQRREDELNAIRCREKLAELDALDRAGGAS